MAGLKEACEPSNIVCRICVWGHTHISLLKGSKTVVQILKIAHVSLEATAAMRPLREIKGSGKCQN